MLVKNDEINFKEKRKEFEQILKEFLVEENKKPSYSPYNRDISVVPTQINKISDLKYENNTLTSKNFSGNAVTRFDLINLFKETSLNYLDTNIKSFKLAISDLLLEVIGSSNINNPLLNRFKLPKIKAAYFTNKNTNFLLFVQDKIIGVTFQSIVKDLFNWYTNLSSPDIFTDFKIVDIITYPIGGKLCLKITYAHSGRTSQNNSSIPITFLEFTPNKLLNNLFDIVKPHQNDELKQIFDTYQKQKEKLYENICEIKGSLISYYYREKNYTRLRRDMLHQSCMRTSDSVNFYSAFEDSISMLALFDVKGKLKGRALLWNGYEIGSKTELARLDIATAPKVKIIDRIYYDCPETANIFISYARNNGIKTGYFRSNNGGLENRRYTVLLPEKSELKNLIKVSNFKELPYMDSFNNYGTITIKNKTYLGLSNSGVFSSELSMKDCIHQYYFGKYKTKEELKSSSGYLRKKVVNNLITNVTTKNELKLLFDSKIIKFSYENTASSDYLEVLKYVLNTFKSHDIISKDKGFMFGDKIEDLKGYIRFHSYSINGEYYAILLENNGTRAQNELLNKFVMIFYEVFNRNPSHYEYKIMLNIVVILVLNYTSRFSGDTKELHIKKNIQMFFDYPQYTSIEKAEVLKDAYSITIPSKDIRKLINKPSILKSPFVDTQFYERLKKIFYSYYQHENPGEEQYIYKLRFIKNNIHFTLYRKERDLHIENAKYTFHISMFGYEKDKLTVLTSSESVFGQENELKYVSQDIIFSKINSELQYQLEN